MPRTKELKQETAAAVEELIAEEIAAVDAPPAAMVVPWALFNEHIDGFPPSQNHESDAAFDLTTTSYARIPAHGDGVVGCNLRLAIPEGHVGLVCPRSGLAAEHGVTVLNAPGVIDAGYRGEVKVVLFNAGGSPYAVEPGDRIAQLIILPIPKVRFSFVKELPAGDRGEAGFGSTGR